MVVIWMNSAGPQITVTEVSSASNCYEAKSQIEAYGKKFRKDWDVNVLCIKK
jgi:hypothetical protein